ncbi:MAG TPA: DivIVA domain-containing protein [Candidatus Eremiobacteraceae bacterium]
MKITPLDIEHKEFKKSLQGYAREEVDQYLDEVAESFEGEIAERAKLEAELADLRERVAHFDAIKETLQNTLVLAQRTADEVKANAHKETDLIKQKAKLEVSDELQEMRHKLDESKAELARMHDQVATVRHDLRSFLTRHLTLIDDPKGQQTPTNAKA